ncbi:MAG: DUF6516 family protein [Dyadobacter sp.]|uniref:toxin-antitoxin system TumE family protein n=1 Tax=Dyadobacter sp. TaxID=1914288 RepID=UPI0032668D8B
MEIFKWLDDSSFVSKYIINDFRESSTAFYLNLEVHFIDHSILYVREFVEPERRKYSFHWQKNSGEVITRWDNAPHFPKISTFPHHKHLGDESVEQSFDISLEAVLAHIKVSLLPME